MVDYRSLDKTDWFIKKMSAGWFSRSEIVEAAVREFPAVPRKTLDGTIGQYWSDCVNPKWGTYKAIQARGRKVVENAGRRRVVETSIASSPILNDGVSTRNVTPAQRPTTGGTLLRD